MTPALAAGLMKAGVWGVSVSIDYAEAEKHDAARGVRGAWQQAWRAVDMLSAARVHKFQRVNVIAVLMGDNVDQMERLLEMSARRQAYFMVQPYSQLKTGSTAYAHNNGPVAPHLLELHRRFRNFLSNPSYLSRFDQYLAGGVPSCMAGVGFFNIDSTGDVAICVERKGQPVGNLYRHDIQTICRRLKAAAGDNTCTGCWYNCRGEVESLYKPLSLLASLPTLLFDRGAASRNESIK